MTHSAGPPGAPTSSSSRQPGSVPAAALAKIPPDTGVITVMRSDQLSAAQAAVQGVRVLSTWLLVVVFALYALGALTACAILALALAVKGWLAALIVAAALGVIAGVLALMGRRNVKQGLPPTPERTIESVKEDVEWAKRSAQEGRR